jgi:phenylalanyl-tRNA synthetase beta chain
MKFSLNWLRDYVEIDLTAEELAEKLTLAGHEVEEIIYYSKQLENIIVGRIESIKPHPDADKLVITQVSDGINQHQIVTGADNIFEGAIVPVSLPGAVLANGMKMKPAKLRGVESFGMLCSEVELGVAEEAAGIWLLPETVPLGVDFIEYAKLKDAVLDISILPNRGDCQSIYGMARDISVILNKPLKQPECAIKEINEDWSFAIQVKDIEKCPYYTARYIKNVQHKETPLWMNQRLQVSGIRSISLLVDITNYVLLELGQPLHAFDKNMLVNNSIIVRTADENEEFYALDEEKRNLEKEALLICDGEKPVALAGIMGGKNSEISDNSSEVLLESAFFHPSTVRRTATKLNLRTESSIRFEKGVDSNLVDFASKRACYLMQELAGGTVISGVKEYKNSNYERFVPYTIPFDYERINSLLGTKFSEKEMANVLSNLGFELTGNVVTVPSWRMGDVVEWPCLAEEIARVLGYHHVSVEFSTGAVIIEKATPINEISRKIEDYLIADGFYQTNTFTMISREDYDKTKQSLDNALEFANPLTIEESVLRQQLLPSILKILSFNRKRQVEHMRFFEIGKVFWGKDGLPEEELHCAGIVTGQVFEKVYFGDDKKNNDVNIFYLKGIVENLLGILGFAAVSFVPITVSIFHPKKAIEIKVCGKKIGYLGLLHPEIVKEYDIDEDIWYFDLNLTQVEQIDLGKKIYSPISKYPTTRRDIALLAPKSLSNADITSVIKKYLPKAVSEYFLFDYFESEKMGLDKKSIAFGFIFQSMDKTLSDKEVNKAYEKFCKKITEELPVQIR